MANPDHLKILKQGVDRWNRWKEKYREVPDLSGADLSGEILPGIDFAVTNLAGAKLEKTNLNAAGLGGADLSKATLIGATLIEANLRRAIFKEANLNGATLRGADLSEANLEDALLIGAKLSYCIFKKANLVNTVFWRAKLQNTDFRLDPHIDMWIGGMGGFRVHNFKNVNFVDADLTEAKFRGSDLRDAIFTNADLVGVDLRGANLHGAKLTGACIEGWSIDSTTKLDGASCDYVYLKHHQQERYPHSGKLAQGEFAKIFQEIGNAVELIFREGISWRAFAYGFNEANTRVIDEYGGELFLQAYEVLADDLLRLKIRYPPGANQGRIQEILEGQYNIQLQMEQMEKKLDAKSTEDKRNFERLLRLPHSQVNITQIGDNNVADNRIINQFNNGTYNESINTQGGHYIQGNYIQMSQDLAQAAREIQEVLQQLQNQGMTEEAAQQQVAKDLAKQAKNNSTVMQRLRNWVQDAAGKAIVTEVVRGILTRAAELAGIS